MKALVVDDEPGMRFMLERVLNSFGHEAVVCDSADAAWDAYQRGFCPLAILDWMMQGMDGLDLCRRIRQAPRGAETVILVVTARSRFEDLRQVLDAGADDYLAKPVRLNDLKVRLAIAEGKVRSIEQRKRIEDAIIRAKQEWERTFDSVPDSIAIIDSEDRIARINKAMAARIGRMPKSLIGLVCDDLAPGLAGSPLWSPHREMMKDGLEHTSEVREMRLGGDFLVSASPFRDPDGRLIGSVHTARDITDLKRAQEELAEARKQEGRMAANIQKTLLLGQLPTDVSGVAVSAHTIPSEEVDGDFYDFFSHNRRCFDLVVGDVMGKGLPAALQGAAVKNEFLRTRASMLAASGAMMPPEPEGIVNAVHERMTPKLIGLDSSVSIVYARFDQAERHVTFVDCGHTKTVHYRAATDECANLAGENVPLGYLEDEVYRQRAAAYGVGDVFFFYSDGITEARNAEGEFFGSERLSDLVRAGSGLGASELVASVVGAVKHFFEGSAFTDDVTCVALKMVGAEEWAATARDEIELLSRLDKLDVARTFVKRFVKRSVDAPLADGFLEQLELAVNEAASNIVMHAYGGAPERTIRIEAESFSDRVAVRLYDQGTPFRPRASRPPTFEKSRVGGYGLFIIERCVDEVKFYRTEDGWNCTSLVKRV